MTTPAIITENTPARSALYVGRRVSDQEAEIRDLVEAWGRERWPGARVCHELTMGHGACRADIAFIGEKHFATVEIKSGHDSVERLLTQMAWFRLTSPETWVIAASDHAQSVDLVRYLLPTIGVADAVLQGERRLAVPVRIDVRAEHTAFAPDLESMAHVLWADELHSECRFHRLWQGGKPPTTRSAVRLLVDALSRDELTRAVCRRLRARDAVWRADPPIPAEGAAA